MGQLLLSSPSRSFYYSLQVFQLTALTTNNVTTENINLPSTKQNTCIHGGHVPLSLFAAVIADKDHLAAEQVPTVTDDHASAHQPALPSNHSSHQLNPAFLHEESRPDLSG